VSGLKDPQLPDSAPRQTPADVLRIEAQALLDAADHFDDAAFEKAVALLAGCRGKAVLIGAGTSGIIAQKIAATLTSTGTPAIFLHPVDALHGGLGAVTGEDVVIAVSNSGETDELRAILPYLRNREVQMIAIVGRPDSTLGRAAHAALDAGAAREACPFNLAPTSSTTLALAVGDALAISLYEVRGLTPERFALNHPSGALGRRLTLRVSDVMHGGHELPEVAPDAGWIDVVTGVSDGGLGAVVVLGPDRELLGIITDGDLRRAMQLHAAAALDTVAATVMTANPVVVGPGELAYNALQLMEDRPSQISALPVVDDEHRCVGLVRVHDLVRVGL
jgi:arabinose-5-phosphate isomerase